MRGAKWCVNQPSPVRDQAHRHIVQTQIDGDLLESTATEKGRDGVGVGDISFQSHAGRHANDVLLGNALHVPPIREFLAHAGQQAGAEVRSDEDDPGVFLGELVDPIQTGLAHGYSSASYIFAIVSGGNLGFVMPGRIPFGKWNALALYRMANYRSRPIRLDRHRGQRFAQRLNVVAIDLHRGEIEGAPFVD